ncbi:MAG: hypothetical protein QOJ02_2838 [Acidobacteriota bacterium]|nr:hypothetical protein [Acidobacteriota bacterium]
MAGGLVVSRAYDFHAPVIQDSFPAPPADRTLIYIADEKNALTPLAFETGTTPLRVDAAAKSDKRSYVELKGERAAFLITNDDPRFYLFLPDEASAKPPFVVRLAEKGGGRRVTAMAQKGYKGFAIVSDEIIKPHYRVLSREGGMIFMEIRMREPLMLGEYAIIGTDLQRIATFRVAAQSNP